VITADPAQPPSLSALVTPTLEALDAALALNRSGVTAAITIRTENDTYAEVERTVRLWVSAKNGSLEFRTERAELLGVVRIGKHHIADVYLPAWVHGGSST